MLEAQLRLLSALHEATRLNAIRWMRADEVDRDIYRASIDETCIEIEFVSVVVAADVEVADRLFAYVKGLGVYFQAAVGTKAYETISAMLSFHVFGWQEGRRSAMKLLDKATARVEALNRLPPESLPS